ncbi:MAG TPA: hypothetical protein VI685_00325 [Candidatus Angelobacter sp.]
MATTKAKRSVHRAQPPRLAHAVKPKNKRPGKPSPGQLVLLERNLPHRRFVEFPLAKGRTVEKVQLFLTSNCNSLTIEFQDKTALSLDVVPGLTINAEFQQREKDDIDVLAEWPPIRSLP